MFFLGTYDYEVTLGVAVPQQVLLCNNVISKLKSQIDLTLMLYSLLNGREIHCDLYAAFDWDWDWDSFND